MPGLKRTRTTSSNDSWIVDQAAAKSKRAGMSPAVRAKRSYTQRALTAKVKKIVTSMAEKKHATFNHNAEQVASYSSTGWSNQVVPLTPMSTFASIAQGVSQDERIGNKIRTQKATFRAIMYPTAYNATSNTNPKPQSVRFVVFSMKGDQNLVPSTLDSFFQNGSSSHPPNGDLGDMIDVINTDLYTVYKDFTTKIGFSSFDQPATGSAANLGYYANNDYPLNQVVKIDATKACPAVINFNDNSTVPEGRAVFVTWFAAPCDGSVDTAATIRARMNYSVDFSYTDE